MATPLRLFVPLLLAALGHAQSDLKHEVTEVLQAKVAADGIPGLSCAIVVGGQIVYSQGFGQSDVENGVPATRNTVYRLASISKPIAAVLALQLVEQGRLDLDRDVHGLVVEWPQKKWPVTTRQLLGHLGGVRHYLREGESTKHYATQREGLERFAADRLLHEPGSRYKYSTYGFNLVAAVVETVHDRSFASVLKQHIAKPCGAPTLQDDDQRRIIENRAQGYILRDGRLQNSQLMDSSYKLGGGGLCSSAPDLARFAAALMAGKLVSKKTLAEMWTTQRTSDGKATGYGMGFSVRRYEGEPMIGHSGAQARVSTMLQMLPEREIAVVVMCNLEGVRLGDVTRQVLKRVLKQEKN